MKENIEEIGGEEPIEKSDGEENEGGTEKSIELTEEENFEFLVERKRQLLERSAKLKERKNKQIIDREIIKFAKKLREKYKDYKEYALYGIFGSPNPVFREGEFDHFDFPDREYSVREFIGELENTLADVEDAESKNKE